jgi:thioredoxin reductase (NADPH)
MPAPMLLAVDADPDALGRVERELRDRYESSYRIVGRRSPDEALALLTELQDSGEDVALVLAAQWLPEMTGSELLERVRRLHPHARRGLLVDWGDWGERQIAEAIFDAMALGRIDYYVLRPAASPDELFHQAISSFLLEWTEARLIAPHTVRIVADAWSGRAYELRNVLQRCAVPHAFHLSDSEEGRHELDRADPEARPPLMILPDGRILSDPTNTEIADATGAWIDPDRESFDVVIIGGGPAGLSAAVYGASEGLETLVVDEGGVGGQASSSALIRNYLGFPRGVSGRRLAQNAYEQAWVFGGYFALMHRVNSLDRVDGRLLITLEEGRQVSAGAVILGMGAAYRRLGVQALEDLNGAGVFYGGPTSEAPAMAGKDAYVVGGANSAGQAALHLARYARRVTLVVRAQSLGAGMSHYLVTQVEAAPNVEVRLGTEVVDGGGDGRLERLVLREGASGAEETVDADGLFVLIGARPQTDWLPAAIAKDRRGFLLAGPDLPDDDRWPLERPPLRLETSMPGVFAAGDVRHGSVKRVASAVGEGSIAIQLVHSLFTANRLHPARPAKGEAPPAPDGAPASGAGRPPGVTGERDR